MHIVITGAAGRVGGRLADLLEADHTITPVDLPDFDLTDPASTDRLTAFQPDVIIHAAAWTDVDGCARDPERALRANAYATRHVALACQRTGAVLAHISTNEVFDGQATRPYLEYDRTRAVNPYGYSKWVAERIVQDLVPQHYIVRLSWLIAHGGSNFVHTILNRARQGQPLRVVTNEIAAPTYNEDFVPALAALIMTGQFGIYHLANEGDVSRWGLARFVLDHAGFADTPIDQVTLAQYPRPSTVPQRAILRNSAAAALGITLRPWQDAVLDFLRREGLDPSTTE